MMMRLILFYSFLFLLSGCFLDQEGQDQSSVEIKMTENVVDGAAGGAILYLINKDLNIQRSFILTENSLNLPLRKGKWDFAIVAWIGDGSANPTLSGAIKCGLKKGVNLVSASESISLTFSDINCGDSFFSPPAHISNGSLKPLSIVNCLVVTNPVAGTYCDSSIGEAGSFKIKLYTKSTPTVKTALGFFGAVNAFLTSPSTSGVNVIESGCIPANSATPPNSVTTTGRYFPFSSPDLFVPVSIEAYSDGTCSSGLKKYIFPTGLGPLGAITENANTLTNTVAKTISAPNSSDLYLAYQTVQITGDTNFGKVYFSNTEGVTNTFTITNNNPTSVTLGTRTITSSSNQMTLLVPSCTTSLAANSSCSFSVKFIPTVKNTSTGNLVVPVNGVNKTLSLTGFGVKDTFKTAPQGLTGFTTPPSNKINSVFIEPSSGNKYVATDGGLAIKSGSTWETKTTANGLGSNIVNSVFAYNTGSVFHIYAATANGLSVSTNSGSSFTNYQSGSIVNEVFAEIVPSGSVNETRVYIGTTTGLKISRDGGASFPYSSSVTNGVYKILVNSSTGEIYYSDNKTFLSSASVTFGTGGSISLGTATIYNFSYVVLGSTTSTTSNARVSDIGLDSAGALYALVSTGVTSGGSSPAAQGLYSFDVNNLEFVQVVGISSLGGASTPVEFSQMAIDSSGGLWLARNNSGLYQVTTPLSPSAGYTSTTISLGSISANLTGISYLGPTPHLFLVGTDQGILEASPTSLTTPSLSWSQAISGGFRSNALNSFGVSGSGTTAKIVGGTPDGLTATSNNWSSNFSSHQNQIINSVFVTPNDLFMGRKSGTTHYVDKCTLSSLGANCFTNINASLTSAVSDIFVSGTTVYVATLGSGIYYADFTPATPTWTQLKLNNLPGLVSDLIKNIYVNSAGNIYVTYATGNSSNDSKISKITLGATNSVNTYGGSSIGGNIQKFYVDPNGQVFVTTANGGIKKWSSLTSFESNANPISISLGTFSTPPVINDIFVKNIGLTQHIVVATSVGLYMSLNGGSTWSPKTIANGLPTNNIKKVYIDSSDDIYVLASGVDNLVGGGLGTTNY